MAARIDAQLRGAMPFDFSNATDYGSVQEAFLLHRLNKILHNKAARLELVRDVLHQVTKAAVKLTNGKTHSVLVEDLFTKEVLATLVLLGASGGDGH